MLIASWGEPEYARMDYFNIMMVVHKEIYIVHKDVTSQKLDYTSQFDSKCNT